MGCKKTILLLIISSFGQLLYAQNYLEYYTLINKAEKNLAISLDSSLNYYNQAFEKYKPIKVDIMNYLILVHKNDKIKENETYDLIKNHLVFTKLERKQICQSLKAIKAPKSLISVIKTFSDFSDDIKYLEEERFYDSLLRIDQRIRHPVIWFYLGLKKTQIIDQAIYSKVNNYISINGYPEISLSPVDDLTLILVHSAQDMNDSTLNELRSKVLEGKLHPHSYAYIYYRYAFFNKEKDLYAGGLFRDSHTSEDINEINNNRNKIGLLNLDEYERIQSLKREIGLFSQF